MDEVEINEQRSKQIMNFCHNNPENENFTDDEIKTIKQLVRDSKKIGYQLGKEFRILSFSIRLPGEKRIIKSITEDAYEKQIINHTEQKLSSLVTIIPAYILQKLRKKVAEIKREIINMTLPSPNYLNSEYQNSRINVERLFIKNSYPVLEQKLSEFQEELINLMRTEVINNKHIFMETATKTVFGSFTQEMLEQEIEQKLKEGKLAEAELLQKELDDRNKKLNEFFVKIEDYCSEKRAKDLFQYSFPNRITTIAENEDEFVNEQLLNSNKRQTELLVKSLFETEINIVNNIKFICEEINKRITSEKKNLSSMTNHKEELEKFLSIIDAIINPLKEDDSSFAAKRLEPISSIGKLVINEINKIQITKKSDNSEILKTRLLNTSLMQLKQNINKILSFIDENYDDILPEKESETGLDNSSVSNENQDDKDSKDSFEINLDKLELSFQNLLALTEQYIKWLSGKKLHKETGSQLQKDIDIEINSLTNLYQQHFSKRKNIENQSIINISNNFDLNSLIDNFEQLSKLNNFNHVELNSILNFLEKSKNLFDKDTYCYDFINRKYSKSDFETIKTVRNEGITKIQKYKEIILLLLNEYQNNKSTFLTAQIDMTKINDEFKENLKLDNLEENQLEKNQNEHNQNENQNEMDLESLIANNPLKDYF